MVDLKTTTKIEQELNKLVEISTTSEVIVDMDMLDSLLQNINLSNFCVEKKFKSSKYYLYSCG